jgi:hypothetical protein
MKEKERKQIYWTSLCGLCYLKGGVDVMKYSCVICAAGSGSRMNLGYNKVFYPISEDKTVLDLTISVFDQDEDCDEIVVVTQKENFERVFGGYICLYCLLDCLVDLLYRASLC